ncbi:MAG: N-acetylmannosamine-6-phosphate 2-epimerase [Candidatus Gastranaerophilales bacterium]|nr:N-acetylmannosamine-6-phosphate 2-epimerase [Candidatus Gastranaerophilales bacterium]
MEVIKELKNKIIVSVQAAADEPLYKEDCIIAMMHSVVTGGAGGLRVAGVRDVKNAKKLFNIPVIGITKPDKLPDNWMDVVYITPTLEDVDALIQSGADIIAFDGTSRERKCQLDVMINRIKSANKLAMADIATLEDGLNCEKLGADILSTTLSGYTTETKSNSTEPDFELLKKLVKNTKLPVILEGRIWEPHQVRKAFELGAYCVVIGSAITRPQLITKRFINEVNR